MAYETWTCWREIFANVGYAMIIERCKDLQAGFLKAMCSGKAKTFLQAGFIFVRSGKSETPVSDVEKLGFLTLYVYSIQKGNFSGQIYNGHRLKKESEFCTEILYLKKKIIIAPKIFSKVERNAGNRNADI